MRARFAVLITAVALTAVAVWLVLRIDPSAAPTNGETTRIRGPVGESMRESSSPDARPDPSPLTTLSDEGLFDHPDCHFTAGEGPASDAGLFIVPGENESRFLVRNQEGALFGDHLPFVPRVYAVGKRDDGVLAVLGDMQLHNRDAQEPQFHGHARVYFNGQIIYENEELWGYGIAADGSSFFAIEPLAGETSRLVLRNLDAGEEHHFDLGRQMTYFDNHGRPYGWYYASSMSEVILAPPQQLNGTPRGIYWFYANDGNGPRVIRIRSADVPLAVTTPRSASIRNRFATSPSCAVVYLARTMTGSISSRARWPTTWSITAAKVANRLGCERARIAATARMAGRNAVMSGRGNVPVAIRMA